MAQVKSLKTGIKFKDTLIGKIPVDWDLKPFIEVMVLQRGFDLPVQNRIKGQYSILASNGIIDCHNEFKVKGPGVITGRSGSLVNVYYIEADYWPLNTTLYVKNFFDNYPKYLYYFLQSFKIEKFGTGPGVPILNRNIVHQINVAIPPLSEQKKIAEILSNVDEAIEETGRIIEKTKELKNGLIQELLTKVTRIRVSWIEFRKERLPISSLKEQKKITNILKNLESNIIEEEKNKRKLEFLKKSLIQVLLTGKKRVKIT